MTGGGAATIWTILTSYITGFFTAGETVLSNIMSNELMATLVIGVPFFAIITGTVLRLANLRRGGRRRR